MILTNIQQVNILLLMLCAGIICSGAYDIFRIIRRLNNEGFLITIFCDTLFWILTFFILFRFLYTASNGELHIVQLLFILLGSMLYFFGPSKIIMRLFSLIKKGKIILKKTKTYRYISK